MAGGLGHRRHHSLLAQVQQKRRGGLEMVVVQIEGEMAQYPHRSSVTGRSKLQLRVLEQSTQGFGMVRLRKNVGLSDVCDRAVRPKLKISKTYGLIAIYHQRCEREQHLTGQVRLRLFLEVVRAGMRLLEQSLQVSPVNGKLGPETFRRERVDRPHISCRLERNRRYFGRFRKGGQRARQIAAPEWVYDRGREIVGTQRGQK